MTLAEKIAIATFVVTVVAVAAALPHPTVSRVHRVLATLILAAVAVFVVVAILSLHVEPNPATATNGTSDTVHTETTPPTTTTKTTTYQAAPEPTSDTMPTSSAPVLTTSALLPATSVPVPTTSVPIHRTPEPQPLLPEVITKPTPAIENIDPRLAVDKKWKQAIAFSNTGDWSGATTAWKQFIHDYSGRDRGTDQEAYHQLGIAYEGLHNWSEAAEAFKQANLADDQLSSTRNLMRLGHCYIQLSRWKDAEDAYKKVLKIDPGNKQAKQSLVWAVKHEWPSE